MTERLMNSKVASSVRHHASEYGVVLALCIIILIPAIFANNFLTPANALNILRQVAFNGLLALGMGCVILTGGIDLSVGSVMALSAVVAASVAVQSDDPWTVALGVGAGLLVALLVGAFNGLLVAKARLAPFIATLATMVMARGAALVYTNGRPISGYTEGYAWIGQGDLLGIPLPVWYFVVGIAITATLLYYTRFGRHVYAVGGNELAALASGIRVDRVKIWTYIACALFAGVSGIALSSRVNAASPIMGEGYELDAIAAVVIGGTSMSGGKGRVMGIVVGALIIGTITNALDILNVSAYYQRLVKGAVILIAVLLDRSGRRAS